MAAGDDDIIESAVVRIGPDTKGFRRDLQAQLKQALAGVSPKVKVQAVADTRGFARDLRTKLAAVRLPTVKVPVQADTRGFARSLRDLKADRTVTVKVQAKADQRSMRDEAGKAARAVNAGAQTERARVQQAATGVVERETNKRIRLAERESQLTMRAVQRQFTGPRIIDWGGRGIRPMNLLYGTITALSPALVAMASSAVQASTSIAALGSAAIGTGLLITGLTVAFNGLTNLLALRKTVMAQQAAEETNSGATATANAEAELRSRNNLLDAQAAQLRSERELHQARRDAVRDLDNIKQKVAELREQQRDDDLSVQEAQARSAATQRSFFATALEKARAAQDARSARVQASGTKLDQKQAKEDLADAVSKGVTKADKVVDAQENLRQARARLAEARLNRANNGITSTANKATSAEANLNAQLAKAAPALREMYRWVVANEDRFSAWARQIQQAFLPGFNDLLDDISTPARRGGQSTLQFFVDQIAELGEIVSKYAGRFGEFTQGSFFREKFGTIQDNNAKSLENLASAAETLQEPLLRIFAAASPLLVKFTGQIEHFAVWLDDVIERADNSGSLAKWFEDAGKQMDNWIGIAKNLLTIVGNIFQASLPAGGSLVERVKEFTGELAKWTGSNAGQEKMKAFFDFFKNLPYGNIAQFFASATELFLAFRVARWAVTNPFWTALGVLATANPAGAAALAGALVDISSKVIGVMAANPAATAALLALLSYAKLRKSFGLDLRIPAIDGLKSALASRFKSLDGLLDGGSRTATMVVHAGVVNVYGGGLPGAGGKPGTPAVIGGNLGTADDAAGGAKTGGTKWQTWAGRIGVAAGAAAAGYAVLQLATPGFKDSLTTSLESSLSGALMGSILGPVGAAAGATIGFVVDQYMQKQELLKTARGAEGQAFKNLQGDIQRFSPGGGTMPVNDPKVLNREYFTKYVEARKKSIAARVEEARAAGGETLAEKVLNQERIASVNTLAQVLTQYGYTAPAAQNAAREIFGSATALTQMTGSAQKAAELAKVVGDEIALAGIKVGDVNEVLDKFSGTRVATLEINGEEVVFPTLRDAMVYQQALRTGDTLEQARARIQRGEDATRRGVYAGYATGGKVAGRSPHPKADNIPAMLTANEYVQPVDAVKHYGLGFMEAIRTKRLPRFAAGGPVMPFKVDVSKTMVPQALSTLDGIVSGDLDVAETVEAVGRTMGASDKQLISAVAAGLVESGLRNLNYGDRDSVGVFQQRPSQGWGSVGQIMNVAYAARKYYEKAMRVDRGMYTAGQLAQQVQVSAFPDRYDQRATDAIAILNSRAPFLSGYTGSNLNSVPYTGRVNKSLGRVNNVSSAIYSAILAAHTAFPRAKVTSSYRPGSITSSGNLSYHARNPSRAADFSPPSAALFEYFRNRYPTARELIYSPAGKRQLKNGEPHYYTGSVRADHFDHVHLALANGGLVRQRTYDSGGTLPPGYTLAFNGTGKNETIRTQRQEKSLADGPVRLHPADVRLLATHIASASTTTVAMDGRVVAEASNKYTYLPAGV